MRRLFLLTASLLLCVGAAHAGQRSAAFDAQARALDGETVSVDFRLLGVRIVQGLWRRSTKTRPGGMTDFIRAGGLLPEAEIAAICRDVPTELILFQDAAALLPVRERPTLEERIADFTPGLE